MFELNKKNIRKILLIITYTILLCFAIIKFDILLNVLGYILNLLKPFIFGFCIAFILNIPLSRIENSFRKKDNKKKKVSNSRAKHEELATKKQKRTNPKLRVLSIILSLLIFIGIIFLTLFSVNLNVVSI